jgi:hypothetical protein
MFLWKPFCVSNKTLEILLQSGTTDPEVGHAMQKLDGSHDYEGQRTEGSDFLEGCQ